MLTGMLEPTDGTATICGFDLRKEPVEVKRRVGFVPDSGAVFESLTGLEYLEMVAALYDIPADAARARIRQINIVGNTKFKEKDVLETFELKTPKWNNWWKASTRWRCGRPSWTTCWWSGWLRCRAR